MAVKNYSLYPRQVLSDSTTILAAANALDYLDFDLIFNPRKIGFNPRNFWFNPRNQESNPRRFGFNPRNMNLNPRSGQFKSPKPLPDSKKNTT